MNIYYASPSQIHNGWAELTEQEAKHASKVMRAREGDRLAIVDGEGGRYEGIIRRITDNAIQLEIEEEHQTAVKQPELVLGMGIIKKRDRLEFAVEKAVELGVSRICLFRSEHTVKQNVRMDRLEATALSAMKQSLRAHLPKISVFNSVAEFLENFKGIRLIAAHEKLNPGDSYLDLKGISDQKVVLLIGPEGGFSPNEIDNIQKKGGELVSLGPNRLRAETAAVAILSKFL